MFICDISILNRYGKQLLDDTLLPVGLDWRELVTLLVIEQLPGIAQARLIPFLQTDKANVTKLLQQMEEKKLMTRETNPLDRRNKSCHLTKEGHMLLPRLHEAMSLWEDTSLQGLDANERALYGEFNKRIIRNLMQESISQERGGKDE
jgi:DNA-binding MarR family transcriptional regulator